MRGDDEVEIKVRNVDSIAVKKIDELAKEKGISRDRFLKGYIETLAFYREQSSRELHLQNLIEKNIQAMQDCYEVMEKMNVFLEMMLRDEEE